MYKRHNRDRPWLHRLGESGLGVRCWARRWARSKILDVAAERTTRVPPAPSARLPLLRNLFSQPQPTPSPDETEEERDARQIQEAFLDAPCRTAG
mmetsp:Transcript_30534/g.60419  ORF Transcript_30534/g.60419 Transcript_30534/m.60419 type:complete len:95 (+) Transcript_30534:401-685(+)